MQTQLLSLHTNSIVDPESIVTMGSVAVLQDTSAAAVFFILQSNPSWNH